jgi:hypothetical protein
MPGAIDNTNLKNYRGTLPAGFTPSVAFTYNAGTGDVVITDGSTIPAGDTLKKIHVKLHDKFGGEVRGVITVTGAPGALSLSASTLDKSKGLDLTATVLTTKMIAADGGAYNIGAAGNIGNWDVQQNA